MLGHEYHTRGGAGKPKLPLKVPPENCILTAIPIRSSMFAFQNRAQITVSKKPSRHPFLEVLSGLGTHRIVVAHHRHFFDKKKSGNRALFPLG